MKFAVLGPLEVSGPTGVLPVRGARQTTLLTMLLMRPGQNVRVGDLVNGLWRDEPPPSAVHNIRTHVSGLRRLLARAGDVASRLVSLPGGYRLTARADELDLLWFTALAERADRALQEGDDATAARAAGDAVALWRGRPLAGLDVGDDLAVQAEALEERYWATFSKWISARLSLGEHDDLVPILREKVQERPLCERVWASLATALHACGRTGDALAACAEARQTFIDELGIEPGPEIDVVRSAILHGTPPAPARPTAVAPPPVTPHQLPPEPGDLVGRRRVQRRLARAAEAVARGTATGSVVLVTGEPGIGKSALAIATARELQDMFPDGQLYVALGGTNGQARDPCGVLGAVLSSLGWHTERLPDDMDGRMALYRSLLAHRRVVVLLDDAASAAQVQPLLPGNGSLGLVTSRRALFDLDALDGVRLDALSDSAALELLAHYVGRERIEAEAEAAHAIVAACAGHPLAIRIAGARMKARPGHPLEVFAERMSDETHRLDEFNFGQLSVRRGYATSYRALDSTCQAFLRSLGSLDRRRITAGQTAVELNVPAPVADRILEALVEHGLLFPDHMSRGQAAYRMPALAHLFARERARIEGIPLAPARAAALP